MNIQPTQEKTEKTPNVTKTQARTGAIQQATTESVRTPRCDIFENNEEYLVLADLPGVESNALQVHVDKRELSLSAKVTWHTEGTRVCEFDSCTFARRFTIPESVNVDGVRAEFQRGVLHLHLPKAKAAGARQVPINVR